MSNTPRSRNITGLPGLIICAAIWLSVGCESYDPSYRHESQFASDIAMLVRPEEFQERGLLSLFRKFVDTDCRTRKLVRLTVSANRWDLTNTNNVSFPEAEPARVIKNGFFRLSFGKPEVAQLWCFDDQASAIVRRQDSIARHSLKGTHDARDLTVKGVKLTLIGVRIEPKTGTALKESQPITLSRQTTGLYARVSDLPGLDVAESIHAELEQKIGGPVFLVLRTDPFFVEYDGPSWDIFAETLPEGSAVRFLGKQHIVCPPQISGGQCLTVTSPPMAPMEAWHRSAGVVN